MTWITHTFFAVATANILALNTVSAAIGSTAPDWLEDLGGIKEHRGITHYLVIWIVLFILSFLYFISDLPAGQYILSFVYGALTHLFLDALTISGIPLYKRQRIRIGGLIKTGKPSEFIFLGLLIIFFMPLLNNNIQLGYSHYKELYRNQIIDKKEYNERKFNIFD